MKPLFRSLAGTLNRLDVTLAGDKAVTLKAWLFVGPLFALFTWIAYRDALHLSAGQLLVLGTVAQIITFGTYVLTRGIVARRSGQRSAVTLFGWYLLVSLPSELIKDALLGISADWQPDRPILWLVVPSSCLIGAVWLTLANLAVNWFSAARDSLGQLRSVEATLNETRTKLTSQLTAELERLREQVEAALVPEIERLRQRLRSSDYLEDSVLLKSAAEIRAFCDQEVRELGREIAHRREAAVTARPSKRLGVGSAIRIIAQSSDTSLSRLYLVMMSLALPYATNSSGYQAILVTGVALTLGYLLVLAVDSLRRKFFAGRAMSNFISSLLMYLAVSFVGVWALRAGLPLYPALDDYVDSLWFLVPAILIFVWAVLGFVFGANQVLKATLNLVAETNEQLAIENHRLQTQAVATRKRVYQLLHGAIQGRLAAVSLALTALVGETDEQKRKDLLAQAVEQIALAESDLKNAFVESPDALAFENRIRDIVGAWRNLLTLEVQVPAVVSRVLKVNRFVADEVLNAIREGITNAHRHASATRVVIRLELVEPNQLEPSRLELRLFNDVRGGTAIAARSVTAATPTMAAEPESNANRGTGLEQIEISATELRFSSSDERAELFASWNLALND